MSAEIKKIVLQLGKKEIELTVEEAKSLAKSLEEMFGQRVIREEHHYHRPYWYWHGTPQWQDTGTKWTFDKGVIYCATGGSNGNTLTV